MEKTVANRDCSRRPEHDRPPLQGCENARPRGTGVAVGAFRKKQRLKNSPQAHAAQRAVGITGWRMREVLCAWLSQAAARVRPHV
eukprot:6188625-Pleurochrysis_carterae.AAC.2